MIPDVMQLGTSIEALLGDTYTQHLRPGLQPAELPHLPAELRALYAWRNGQVHDEMIFPFHFLPYDAACRSAKELYDLIPELGEGHVFLISNSWGNGVVLACPHSSGAAIGTYTFDGQIHAEHDSIVAMLQTWIRILELHAHSKQSLSPAQQEQLIAEHSPRAGDHWESINDWRNHYLTRSGRRIDYDDRVSVTASSRVVALNNTFKLHGRRFQCPVDLRGQTVQLHFEASQPHRVWVFQQSKPLGEAILISPEPLHF